MPDVDPIKLIPLKDVIARTGFSERTISRRLARDAIDRTPGHNFPAPITRGRKKMWRLLTIIRWLEMQEATVS